MTNEEYKKWQQGGRLSGAKQSTNDRGYGRYHKMERLVQLGKHPFCQINITSQCTKEQPAIATELDHIVPIRVRPDLAHQVGNHQSACKPCNVAKAKLDAKRFPIKHILNVS